MARDDLHRSRSTIAAWRGALAMLALGLTGCTSLGPYEGPQVNADEHTLCYTRAAATQDQLKSVARDACGGAEPQLHRQVLDWSACPILVPERLYFSCGAG